MDERTKKPRHFRRSPGLRLSPALGSIAGGGAADGDAGGGGGALLDRLKVAKGLPCYSTATATGQLTATATGTLAYCQINIR